MATETNQPDKYVVRWEIEWMADEARDARHAAELSHGVMLDPKSPALYFTVNGEEILLDAEGES